MTDTRTIHINGALIDKATLQTIRSAFNEAAELTEILLRSLRVLNALEPMSQPAWAELLGIIDTTLGLLAHKSREMEQSIARLLTSPPFASTEGSSLVLN